MTGARPTAARRAGRAVRGVRQEFPLGRIRVLGRPAAPASQSSSIEAARGASLTKGAIVVLPKPTLFDQVAAQEREVGQS